MRNQAQKLLEKESCETWFDDAKSRLHMAEIQWRAVRFLVGEAQFFFTHMSMPQRERRSKGGKICFWRDQNFWVGLVYTKLSVDIQKKRSSRQYGLLFSEVSVGFHKKKLSFWNCCNGNESLGGHAGQFGGEEFCLGGAAPFFPPPSSGPDTC